MEDNYKARVEANIGMIGTLRQEIDDQRNLLVDLFGQKEAKC
jgi:hypothetical protein